ncbi:hypothetical protein [Haloplanus sp. C73]|uniref:hypothetical protein n=1 Tax=Haloplanus sp. C73 TaxID=3421641 RepID=UPI003EBD0ED4
MGSRENQILVASGVVALAVLFALRAVTNVGVVSRFAIVVVAILVTQSALGRV